MGGSRKDVLLSALETELGIGSADLSTLFTDDVVGWSPLASVSGAGGSHRGGHPRPGCVLQRPPSLRGLDEVGNKAFAEWLIEADHTGTLVLNENAALDATGRHVQMAGVTVADFRDGKIRSYRTYFDDASLIEQLVGD